jgi:uncharacterized protein (TIGR02594 family)
MKNTIEIALSQYGITEILGHDKNNPEIMKYFSEIGKNWVKDDETAWCSAFVNWVCKKAGHGYSGELNARSWLQTGIETKSPEMGDIVVFWRESPDSWKGHVAFYIKEDKNHVWVLGGNQNNQVNIRVYLKSQLLQYRSI